MATVAIHTQPPGIIAAVAPLGLAHSRPTALVIDLDPSGVRLPGSRTLRDLVSESPSAADLRPRRTGTACLPNGNIRAAEAAEVIRALIAGWPATVLRVADEVAPFDSEGVGVRAVLPGMTPPAAFLPVYQPTGLAPVPRGLTGLILPRLSGRVAGAVLGGTAIGGRWAKAWGEVWDLAAGARR